MITGVPAEIPDTTPEDASTVAIAVLLLVHVPPEMACARVLDAPTHAFVVPVMVASAALTVTCVTEMQPAPDRINDMLAVPVATPVTIPVADPTVALVVVLLAQVPPPEVLMMVVVPPAQMLLLPEFAGSAAFTVTVMYLAHPVANV